MESRNQFEIIRVVACMSMNMMSTSKFEYDYRIGSMISKKKESLIRVYSVF